MAAPRSLCSVLTNSSKSESFTAQAADPFVSGRIKAFKRLSGSLYSLISEYAQGHAPHALLLSGPFGVGKSTLSLLLTMALLCEAEEKPCGMCPGCRGVRSGSHTNVITLKALPGSRTVKVEQARDLISSLSSYPFSRGMRVVKMELVDTFTPAAQNALLKAVEEPDDATCFILTSIQEKAVLPTIRSRCRHVRLPVWPPDMVEELMRAHGIPEHEAQDLSALCGGSPGKALQIREDEGFLAVRKAADASIFSIRDIYGFPAASALLKDVRDSADLLLDYAENAALRSIDRVNPDNENTLRARRILEAVLISRKRRASNLSWQAVADEILLNILEE